MDPTRRQLLAGSVAAGLSFTGLGRFSSAAPARPSSELEDYDMLGLADLVRRKQVSPTELLDLAIERVEAVNSRLNFIAQRTYDYGRVVIANGLPEGPFAGVPWLLKDVGIYIKGQITTAGSRYYTNTRASETSELVKRYEAAGLVIFGRTTTPELALKPTTESVLFGPTRNPWNPEHTAGGSSGGAAVAVAAGVLPGAHGTDGGGSIRIPASCCGVFGLKPSRARVPSGPQRVERTAGFSADHALTRTVRDSAALLDISQGPEFGSRFTAPTPQRPYLEEVSREPGRLRIALQTEVIGANVHPECVEAAKAAARLCEGLGHYVEEAAPQLDIAALRDAQFVMASSTIAADLSDHARRTGIDPGPDVLEATVLTFFQNGLKILGVDYARANNLMQEAAIKTARFMQNFDVLLSPTLGVPPPRLGFMETMAKDMKSFGESLLSFMPFTAVMNMTGQPSMSVPLAMSKAGLPIGIMFTARYGDEATLFRLAGQLERAVPWAGRKPPISISGLRARETNSNTGVDNRA